MKNLTFLFCLIVICSITNLPAQKIFVHLQNDRIESFPVKEINSITYSDDMMYFNRYDGELLAWKLKEVQHYRFHEKIEGIDPSILKNKNYQILKFPDPEKGMVDFDGLNKAIEKLTNYQFDQAKIILNEYIANYPLNEYAHNLRGNAKRYDGKPEASIPDYDEAIKLNPLYYHAYCNRGFSYLKLNRIQEAIADFTRAIEIDPLNPRGFHERGYVHQNAGNKDAAFADYNKAIEIDSSYLHSYIDRAVLKSDNWDIEGAIKDYQLVLEMDAEQTSALNNLGNILMDMTNYSQQNALDILTKFFGFKEKIELQPDEYNVNGNPEIKELVLNIAVDYFDRAISASPKNINAYHNNALAHLYLDLKEDACKLWKIAYELGDQSAWSYIQNICVDKD